MRIICVAFTGLVALAAVSAQIAPNPENWLPLGSALSFGLVTKRAGTAGIRPYGATGAAIVGGVRACPIDDLVLRR